MLVAQHPPADAVDERTVPANQFGKRRLIALTEEAIEQLSIGRPRLAAQAPQAADHIFQRRRAHRPTPIEDRSSMLIEAESTQQTAGVSQIWEVHLDWDWQAAQLTLIVSRTMVQMRR